MLGGSAIFLPSHSLSSSCKTDISRPPAYCSLTKRRSPYAWSRPSECYPPSPSMNSWVISTADKGYIFPILYHYYPGVLPSGLTVISSLPVPKSDGNGGVLGCPPYVVCVSTTRGTLTPRKWLVGHISWHPGGRLLPFDGVWKACHW